MNKREERPFFNPKTKGRLFKNQRVRADHKKAARINTLLNSIKRHGGQK